MKLTPENEIINGLWIGEELSHLELLTLHSFISHGHRFHLWVYGPLNNTLPEEVVLKDANEILPQSAVYRRKYNDSQFNIGKGSVGSPFSDLFRYKLLYEKGGWWVDMDVTCLKPLQVDAPYFFRSHPLLPMIGNVLKVPPQSTLMKEVFEEVNATCDENTREWLKPNMILNEHIKQLGLEGYIVDNLSTSDWWEKVEIFIKTDRKLPESWKFIHWMNEEWRVQNLDKNKLFKGTRIGTLCELYAIPTQQHPFFKKWKTKILYSLR
jgi:hypothetical protein